MIQQHDDERLNLNCRKKVVISDNYRQHWVEFLKLLEEFEDKCEGYLETIITAKHRIKLVQTVVRPVHSAPYRAGARVRQFAATELERVL